MARMTFKLGDEYAIKLSRLEAGSEQIARKAISAAADIVTDEIRTRLEGLPIDAMRLLQDGEKFKGLPIEQKADLLNSLGITPFGRDGDGNFNVKVGFDGYGSRPTKSYPQGLPNQLLARAVESGSTVRQKTPFVRPAVNAKKKEASQKMQDVCNEEIEKIMGRGTNA